MFERASADLGIDLRKALFIGDRFRDVEPAVSSGGQGVLVPTTKTPHDEIDRAMQEARVADSLATVLDWYLCTN